MEFLSETFLFIEFLKKYYLLINLLNFRRIAHPRGAFTSHRTRRHNNPPASASLGNREGREEGAMNYLEGGGYHSCRQTNSY